MQHIDLRVLKRLLVASMLAASIMLTTSGCFFIGLCDDICVGISLPSF
jgi:hypothetical protein